MSVLGAAAFYGSSPGVIAAVVDAGADVNGRDHDGRNPLMIAAVNNPDPEVIVALLKAGAIATYSDAGGRTALDHAEDNPKLVDTEAIRMIRAAAS
ncbi:MAG: ankyrin repeat domain-containing protein [Phycisphaerales bacterium]|nr:ankyrin repeat domain-containing protein [Phycisphaerales bacterium]